MRFHRLTFWRLRLPKVISRTNLHNYISLVLAKYPQSFILAVNLQKTLQTMIHKEYELLWIVDSNHRLRRRRNEKGVEVVIDLVIILVIKRSNSNVNLYCSTPLKKRRSVLLGAMSIVISFSEKSF
ncbi:hypothetical protein KIN20_011304 [Parelaphostrongylus tenuis]|uniref:Uncharacterized protein n=1 Tax=Parelaphostrongylus tenuis TaxID=148309 RepID=A0AAD5MCP0_PARTN|nr:hypothetical protein KIN20_011304 [Parelaphostrongylus tenuis]